MFMRKKAIVSLIYRKTALSDHIVEQAALPEDLIKGASGQIAFEEEGTKLFPIDNFPDPVRTQKDYYRATTSKCFFSVL